MKIVCAKNHKAMLLIKDFSKAFDFVQREKMEKTLLAYKVKSRVGNPKALFSITAKPRCKGVCYSFHWIAPLYP